MQKKHQPGCECCGCAYFFDDFNRSDDTNVGGNYTETSGDWSILNTALLIQDDDARLDIDVAHPDALADGIAIVAIYAFHDGDEVRVIFDYVDASNYFFAQLTIGEPGELAIYRRESGTNTLLSSVEVDAPAAEFHTLYVYWGEECAEADPYIIAITIPFSGGVTTAIDYIFDGTVFTTDAKALGTGSITSAVYFDQLYLWKHKSSTNDTCPCYTIDCRSLFTPADTETQPDCSIEYVGACGWCTVSGSLEQSGIPFNRSFDSGGGRFWQWQGTASPTCVTGAGTFDSVSIRLDCFEPPFTPGWAVTVFFGGVGGGLVNQDNTLPPADRVLYSTVNSLTTNADGEIVGTVDVEIYTSGGSFVCSMRVIFGP